MKVVTSDYLAVDPDTHACGWAIGDVQGPRYFGVIKDTSRKRKAWDRVENMALRIFQVEEVAAWVTWADKTSALVVEMPGRQGPRGREGQATYGLAPQGIYSLALGVNAAEFRRIGIPVHDWTRGKRKETRAREVAAAYPTYRLEDDPGRHIADAIGLLTWFAAVDLIPGDVV